MATLNTIQSWVASMKKNPSWEVLVESARSATSGAAFGAALTAAGVHSPDVIVNQFRLKDFHMFHVFTVALGTSVFVIALLDRYGLVKRQVRPSISLGLFSPYDGNIIGGVLVGVGMSMSGSCPGTVTAQLAQGVPTASITAIGGVLGGMAHVYLNRPGRSRATSRRKPSLAPPQPKSSTLTEATGIPEVALYTIFGCITASLIYLSTRSTAPFWATHSAGGLYLGSAQLVSLLVTSSSLGASGIYDQAARYAWRILGRKDIDLPSLPPKSILFAGGAVFGSALLTSTFPRISPVSPFAISTASALVGGFLMAFGAKIAKGCTSGHGLSGLGSLSFSSLITVASMFGAGIAYQFL